MGYCKKHDAYNGNGICPYCDGRTINHTGDFAIPDEVVDLNLLLEARRRIDELEAENERLKADVDTCSEVLKISEQERERISNIAATRNTELVIKYQTLQEENERLREDAERWRDLPRAVHALWNSCIKQSSTAVMSFRQLESLYRDKGGDQ